MAQTNVQKTIANFQQFQQKSQDMWHNDFFASMSNQAFNEPSLSWSEGSPLIDYQGTKKVGDVTSTWGLYARAAKSRGVIPDYARFMETFKTVKASKGTQLLSSISQLYGMHGDKQSFNLALEESLRGNEVLREDLMRAVRTNPEDPNAAQVASSIKNASAGFWDRAGERGMRGVKEWVPGYGVKGGLGVGAKLLTSGPFADAAKKKAGAKAAWHTGAMGRLRGVLPMASTKAHFLGLKGKGPLKDYYKGLKKGPSWAKKSISKVNYYKQFGGGKKALPKILKDLGVFTDIKGQPKLAGGKPINWGSIKDKKAYLGKVNARLDDAMAKLRKGGVGKASLKEMQNYKNSVNSLLSQKSIKKDAVKKLATTVSKGSGSVITNAIKKVGWSGILKQAYKQSPKLALKLGASGLMKAATPFTAGISGLVSAGMDAWMAYDLIKLATNIMSQETGKTTFTTGGLTKDTDNIAGY
jgi:hypothetical protein